jgi:hypothetical protein
MSCRGNRLDNSEMHETRRIRSTYLAGGRAAGYQPRAQREDARVGRTLARIRRTYPFDESRS